MLRTLSDKTEQESDNLTLWQVISSVLAAAFGVQNDKNRQRDFSKAKPTTYIFAGVIFTLAFILVLALIVKLILGSIGA